MTCPACRHENRAHAKFCEECGTRLEAPTSRAEFMPRSYTPRHLAERILGSRSALEGERKQVTVLFVDVKGSMELAEELEAEEWHRLLDRFFAILGDGIHRFEGTINQYTGDGVMALFGAPIAHEDHARRACYAALALRTDLRSYSEELKRTRGVNFSVRMGLHSGEVVVGRIGDDLRMDYTAQGQTVGLAQRMEQLAAPGSAYVTEATARLVEGFVELRDLGNFDIRGATRPIHVFELGEVGSLRTRFDLSRSRGLSLFVGRADELKLLEEKLERALAGEAQIISLVGEAGVGKSRLSFEFLERCRARGIRVAEGHAVSHGRTLPLLPWLSLFRSSFDVDERDDPESAREKVAGRSVLWDPGLSSLLPVVFDFMGIADPEAKPLEMDPDARKRKLLDFVCRASEARNRQQGGVLLWEDLHWLDPASDQMLTRWLEAIAGTRTLVVTNYRPEYVGPWHRWSNHTTERLRPLGSPDVRALLTDLLGTDPTVYALPRMIEERTRGNPFFIEEVVQSLIESGALRGKRGAYTLHRALRSVEIPGSVRAVLSARIDRLGEDEKALLQTASILGKNFEEPVLEKTTGLPRSRLAAPLASLESADLLFEDALFPVRRFAFKHPLTQEVAYHSQLQDRRAEVHAAAARAIADLYADRLDEKSGLLADHWERAGKPLAAARWHARASLWVGTQDIPEALRHDRRVLELLARSPSSDETKALGVQTRARLLQLAWRAGMDSDEEDRLFEEGTRIATEAGDEAARASIAIPYGVCLSMRGDEEGRERLARETYRRATELGDHESALRALVPLSTSLLVRGKFADLKDVLDLHRRDLDGAPADADFGEFSVRMYLISTRGRARANRGRFGAALADARRALSLATADGRIESEILARVGAAEIHVRAGDALGSTIEARHVLDLAERHGAPTYVAFAHMAAAQAHLLAAEYPAAIDEAHTAEGTILAYGLEGLRAEQGQILASAQLELAPEEAASTARETIELARRVGYTRELALSQLTLAATLEPTEADALLDEARRTMEDSLLRGHLPFVEEARAHVARRANQRERARTALARAHTQWLDLGAPGHAQRVEARSTGL